MVPTDNQWTLFSSCLAYDFGFPSVWAWHLGCHLRSGLVWLKARGFGIVSRHSQGSTDPSRMIQNIISIGGCFRECMCVDLEILATSPILFRYLFRRVDFYSDIQSEGCDLIISNQELYSVHEVATYILAGNIRILGQPSAKDATSQTFAGTYQSSLQGL